jgi:UDP-N-acetylglucosamine 2-epimerase (non-hydrolysing)
MQGGKCVKRQLKVLTLVGTRPEIIKLSRVIAELERHTRHVLVHSGQNFDYQLNEVFFRDLEIRRPDYFLQAACATPAETIAKVITAADAVFAAEGPDAVLIYGDTNSCLAAIAAKRRKIPVFHMEAGNRCFDQRVPEEINRKIIDHISDINMPLTEHARRYLLQEGLRPETVIKTGSTMTEVLEYYRPKHEQSDILERLDLQPREYFVVSAHREENVDSAEGLVGLVTTLNAVAQQYRLPVLVSLHPRTQKRLAAAGIHRSRDLSSLVHLARPFGFFDYIKLQTTARCVISDSGTLTEEAALLDFPAVMLRQAHERPEGMDEATVIMSDLAPDRVLQAIDLATSQHTFHRRAFQIPDDYQARNVSQKVVRIIVSYVDYINRTVWHRSAMPQHPWSLHEARAS